METVAVCASGNSVAIWRATHFEFIENSLVLKYFAQLSLHRFVEESGRNWFFRVTYVPHLD